MKVEKYTLAADLILTSSIMFSVVLVFLGFVQSINYIVIAIILIILGSFMYFFLTGLSQLISNSNKQLEILQSIKEDRE